MTITARAFRFGWSGNRGGVMVIEQRCNMLAFTSTVIVPNLAQIIWASTNSNEARTTD